MGSRYEMMRQSSEAWKSLRDGDFEEEDVWSLLKDRTTTTQDTINDSLSLLVPHRVSTSARMIPKTSSGSTVNSSHEAKIVQQSAPMNIPNWSTSIYRHKSTSNDDDDGDGDDDDDDDDDGCYVDEYDCKEPPHEFIAKRLAKSQISSFSVFEGIGRTLKGRDLSKVRNAVLIKTGFLESL